MARLSKWFPWLFAALIPALMLWKLHAFLINPDGVGYFVYLPALGLQRSFWLGDLFREMNFFLPQVLTDAGLLGNPFPVGAALLWMPCFAVFHALLSWLSPHEAGSLLLYRYASNWASMLYGASAALLAFDALRPRFRRPLAACLLAFFGTPLFYYVFWDTSMSHATSAFAVGAFLWLWLRTGVGNPEPQRWLALGLVAGLAGTVRLQDLAFAAVLAVDARAVIRDFGFRRFAGSAAACAAGAAAGFAPQLYAWEKLYGAWFANPQMSFLQPQFPKIAELLFSPHHGFLFWTPLALFALAGLALELRGARRDAARGLALAFAIQLLVVGFDPVWSQGYAFGMRRFTSSFVVFAFGMAAWMDRARWKVWLVPAALAALWTFGLALCSSVRTLNLYTYYSPAELMRAQVEMLSKLSGASIFAIPEQPHRLPARTLLFLLAAGACMLAMAAAPVLGVLRNRLRWSVCALGIAVAGCLFAVGQASTSPPDNFQAGAAPIVTAEEFRHHIRLLNDFNLLQYHRKAGHFQETIFYVRRVLLNPASNPLSHALKEIVQKDAWPLDRR